MTDLIEINNWTFIEYWGGENKYNEEALNKYFGKYMT